MHSLTPATNTIQTQRQLIMSADQLPRREITLEGLPSEYLSMSLDLLAQIGATLESNLKNDLEKFDIRDTTTLCTMYTNLATLAKLRGGWAEVCGWSSKIRALQEKPGARLTKGVVGDLIAQQQLEKKDDTWLGAEVVRLYSAMPWSDVQEFVKLEKAAVESFNPEAIRGTFQLRLDVVAKNGNMHVSEEIALATIACRIQIASMETNKSVLVNALQAVIEANKTISPINDIWEPRTFQIPTSAHAKPVVIGVWDSGVDLSLFPAASSKGIAFDDVGHQAEDLLRPLGEAQSRWPQLRGLIKGAMDHRAALDTPDAQHFSAIMSNLKADQIKQFSEDMTLTSLYVHGTHVAGIAMDGNPYAEIYTGTMLWHAGIEPPIPSETYARTKAASYKAMVQHFVLAGVRVVNMSWRYNASGYEKALAYHNLGGSIEERKNEAQRLFDIERDGLQNAIMQAPDILFVAGAGNEDNNADFQNYIPAGLALSNLITVGASDSSGRETSFSTFGKTVVVHANGLEIESMIPGGERMKFSGTSMASPQVANLAAKLMALKPELTALQVKALILQGADRQINEDGKPGRVNLINPRKSAELAGLLV